MKTPDTSYLIKTHERLLKEGYEPEGWTYVKQYKHTDVTLSPKIENEQYVDPGDGAILQEIQYALYEEAYTFEPVFQYNCPLNALYELNEVLQTFRREELEYALGK